MNRTLSVVAYMLVAAGLLMISPTGFGQAYDVNLSNDSAQFRYIVHDPDSSGLGNKEIDAGLMYSADNVFVGMFGAQVVAEAGSRSPGLDAGLGFKAFGAGTKDNDHIFALTLGGQLHFVPPPWPRVGASVQGFYSPNVVTFADGDSFSYISAALEYRVLPQAMIYLGYRKVHAGLESGGNGSVTIESGGHVGMKLEF